MTRRLFVCAFAAVALLPGRAGAVGAAAGWSLAPVPGADPRVLDLAASAAACAVKMGDVTDPPTLTVIDYSKPSTARRMWVFDHRTGALLFETLVAHGQGSGGNLAQRFSNEPDTHESSLGLYVARDAYVGHTGYSLRLDGLDRGFNDRARERAIVVHGAWYVSDALVRAQGQLGRSWGCPALPSDVVKAVIDRVKGGGLIFAYYPDARWLASSKYLGSGCNR